jgi:hypothetical protein
LWASSGCGNSTVNGVGDVLARLRFGDMRRW